MNRRKFIFIPVLGASLYAPYRMMQSSCQKTKALKKSLKPSLKGFIVSDAHIGWRGKDQPSPETQIEVCKNIKEKFDDLDILFDTGDVHHGYLNEAQRKKARTLWLDNIANQFDQTPFHYIPGNHELGKGDVDPEVTAGLLGSIPFRPYYSFDYMGIHLVSLPQLFNTIFLTKESLNWLSLDLEINKNKSTIILSHNSIKGTTYNNGETGYRVIANSDEIMEILDNNKQVIGWFHGHNHLYDIVKFKDKLFVSNGRIGGFDPPKKWGDFGHGHLGGIYFEISETKFVVKAYSATKSKFFEKIGFPALSHTMTLSTSFNPKGAFNYYFGHGLTTNDIPYAYNNHYISKKKHTLFYKKAFSPINEHTELNLPTEYIFANKKQIKMIGYKFNNRKIKYTTKNNNLNVENPKNVKSFKLMFPNHFNKKHQLYKRGSYYRCSNNQDYVLTLKARNLQSSPKLKVYYLDQYYSNTVKSKIITAVGQDNDNLQYEIKKIALEDHNDKYIYFRFELSFDGEFEPFEIHSLVLLPEGDDIPNLSVDYLGTHNKLNKNNFVYKLGSNNTHNSSIRFQGMSNNRIAWVSKISNILWQVRNATVKVNGDEYEIIQSNSTICFSDTILLTPTIKVNFYPYKFVDIKKFKVKTINRKYIINIDEMGNKGEIYFNLNNGDLVCPQAQIRMIKQGIYALKPLKNVLIVENV